MTHHPYTAAFLAAALLAAGPAAAQLLLVDNFNVDQGPYSGQTPFTSEPIAGVLGGTRAYVNNFSDNTFAVADGQATYTNTDTEFSNAYFLVYDANGTSLNLDLTPYKSAVIDVTTISGSLVTPPGLSRFSVASPGDSSSLADPRLHRGRVVMDFADFIQGSASTADFSNIEQITIESNAQPGQSFSYNQIYFSQLESVSIGDRVWNDLDGDGIQDPGEPGILDAQVNLYGSLSGLFGPIDLLASRLTDFDGNYDFGNLPAGEYELEFVLPAGASGVSPANATTDDLDSDIDPVTLRTGAFNVADGVDITNLDAGFIKIAGDFNGDGTVDADDIDLLFDNLDDPQSEDDPNLFYDLNGDFSADQADVTELVTNILNTFFGDANLNGSVGTDDLAILAGSFDQLASSWAQADFNGDDFVDTADLAILAGNFGNGTPPVQAATTPLVPEPASLALLGLGGLLIAQRRRP